MLRTCGHDVATYMIQCKKPCRGPTAAWMTVKSGLGTP